MNRWMRVLIVGWGLWATTAATATSFTTLAAAQAYAKKYPEYVAPDNKDWLVPDFRSFHKKMTPQWFQRIAMRAGWSDSFWDWRSFKTAINTLTEQRAKEALPNDFSERFTPEGKDQFIIWGDLYGAFHSLVRDLTYLQQQKIIDNNLKIKSHYYFVFNGNVIEGSPYVLETLELIIRLMIANPDQVFYTRGYY
jgi:hypothetical protein